MAFRLIINRRLPVFECVSIDCTDIVVCVSVLWQTPSRLNVCACEYRCFVVTNEEQLNWPAW